MPRFPITEAQFRAWRKEHPRSGVRHAQGRARCPIERCVIDLTGKDYIWCEETNPSPQWVYDFVEKFDAGGDL